MTSYLVAALLVFGAMLFLKQSTLAPLRAFNEGIPTSLRREY